MSLKGRNAIVTGSTSGIGLGIATVLAKAGANILINGFADADVVEKIKADISALGVKVEYNGADVTKPEQIKGMIEQCVNAFGSIDILINNAGIQYVSPVEDFPIEKWDAVIATNLSSAFYAAHVAVPYMRKGGYGRIISTASAHGLVASKGKAAYVAAKHGIVGLTKVIGLENAGTGVTANAICPGWVLTPLVQAQIDAIAAKEGLTNEQASEKLLSEKQPSKQFATPEDIGELAVFLCSDAAKQITGASYTIDGGWTAQ